MTFFDPSDWRDVIVNILIFGALVIPAYFGYRSLRKDNKAALKQVHQRAQTQAEIAQKVNDIGEQVINGHPDPLRKDLDRYFKELNLRLDKHDVALEGLNERTAELNTSTAVNHSEIKSIGRRVEGIEHYLRGH